MSLEQGPFLTLTNRNQDAIAGIGHNNPNRFKRSYWKELLENQIRNCDGEREFILIMAPDFRTKVGKTKIFKNLPENARNLSPAELDIFLSGFIDDISNAKTVFLIEINKGKFIPINENLPPPQVPRLSNDQLQNLVGDLPSLDNI